MNEPQKTVCWNGIVKNEAAIIERCMESLVREIDYWVVVDTGSDDGTQEVIQNFMDQHGVPGELHERPWRNFGANRSEAVELAEGKADYLLFCDADMALNVLEPDWKNKLEAPCYLVNQRTESGLVYGNVRLINARLEGDARFRYWGATHEYCDPIEPSLHDRETFDGIEMLDFADGGSKSDKYERDIRLLSEQIQALKALTPAQPDEFEAAWRDGLLRHAPNLEKRCTFYLAQSWRDSGEPEIALANYRKRVKLGGWKEEVWYALFQVALLKEQLEYSEEDIVGAYLEAYQYRPHRAESLYHLARYFREQENYAMGYVYALAATSMEQPDDILFMASDVYEWKCKDELAVCAYWLGKYQMSASLCDGLLSNPSLPDPVRSRVENNLNSSKAHLSD